VIEELTRKLGLEPGERRLLVWMGVLVGILFCAYTVAKVQRDAIFLAEFGPLALPYAYVAVAFCSVFFVWMEGRMARRFTRVGAMRMNQYVAIAFSLAAALVFPLQRHWTAGVFYLWTGSQAMILLPHFWVLALDVWDFRRARKLFPLFSACGLAGGLLGGSIAGWLTPFVKRVGLLWILGGLLIVSHLMTRFVDSHRKHRPSAADVTAAASRWEILRRSHYIQILTVAIALSVVVGTVVDFQFKFFAAHAYPDPHDLTQFLGKFYAAMNGVSLLFQVFLAGWLLRRLDLLASTSLQPISIMALGAWASLSLRVRPMVFLRGAQGVLSQVLGKPSTEIYYMAVRPPERRVIKPAIDTLVERWSDAIVGVLLLVALRTLGVGIPTLAVVTVVIAAIWLLVLIGLHRQYLRAIQSSLSTRWAEPEAVAESLRAPAARAALLQTLGEPDERRVLLALRISEPVQHPDVIEGIRKCMKHSSARVRATVVEMMERKRSRDSEREIEGFLHDPDERVRRAAVGYLLTMSRQPTAFVRNLLEGEDPDLRRQVLDALSERPHEAPSAIPPQWIEARLRSGTQEDLLLAARALGTVPRAAPPGVLRRLIEDPDPDVRRAALLAAARRPAPELGDAILVFLDAPDVTLEVRDALAAIGDPVVPSLARLLTTAHARAQTLAARTLAQIGTPRAIDALLPLARSGDRVLRHLGLRNLSRVRVQRGEPVLPRALAHRFFLRDLREYRVWLTPALRLESAVLPELRLLGSSYREFADMALERAVRALACWYEPRALFGAFEPLRRRNLGAAAPALEYLSHVLPRSVFRPMRQMFEDEILNEEGAEPAGPRELSEWIRAAWKSGDAWLRACAVHVSRHVPDLTAEEFALTGDESAVVRAEVEARFRDSGGRLPAVEARTPA